LYVRRAKKEAMLIAHLDADCFYVSAERVRDSFLNKKPVGVLGNQGACVIAKSYEMKKAGVGTGELIWEAVKKCPDGLYLKRDFRWYEVVSKEMLTFVRNWAPFVEYYSIDEFFLAVDASDPQRFAESIRDQIWESVGVPVTIGVARTRTLAKLVSDLAKPFGALALLGTDAEKELLVSRPVSDVTGIAARSAAKLAVYGITSCWDFACAPLPLIRRILSVVGERLSYELRGEKAIPIQTTRPPHKILSRGGSIGQPSADPAVQWAWAIRNLERLVEALEFHGLMTGRLRLILEYKDGPSVSRDSTFLAPTNRFNLLLEAVQYMWSLVSLPGLLYRMHYLASDLQYPGTRQLCLFDTPPAKDPRAVEREINERFGRFKVRSAATLPLAEIYFDDAHGYEICDVQGKTCF
jgi:DNA polymerase V